MEEDINWKLILRHLRGDCTPKEKIEMQTWLDEDIRHRRFLEAIEKVWEVTPGYEVSVDFEQEWEKISHRLGIDIDHPQVEAETHRLDNTITSRSRRNDSVKQLLRVAAIILIIVVPTIFLIDDFGYEIPLEKSDSPQAQVAMQKVQTQKGEKASLEFSDGSTVLLNSQSTIRFPKIFGKSKREIYLQGEAFFRIAHDADHPFVVHSGDVAVKVLGTEFNVNAYNENKAVEVVVREGKVAVQQTNLGNNTQSGSISFHSKDKSSPGVILTKGQRSLVKIGEYPTTPENISLKPYLAWVNGRFIFEGTPFREVVSRLNRAFNLEIEVADSTLLEKKLTASFKRETPEEKILKLVAFSLDISYELRDDTVIFKPNLKRSTQ